MDSLRLSLIVIGAAVVLAIYLRFRSSDQSILDQLARGWSMLTAKIAHRSPSSSVADDEEEIIPTLLPTNDDPDLHDFEQLAGLISSRYDKAPVNQDERPLVVHDDDEELGGETLLFVIFIIANNRQKLAGQLIHDCLLQNGFSFAENGVFDYMVSDRYGRERPLFSIANALEPGTFDQARMEQLQTPGIVSIMQLPGPQECRMAFDTMLDACKKVAITLDAELYDEKRSILRAQTISHFRDQLEQYRLRQKMSQRRKQH